MTGSLRGADRPVRPDGRDRYTDCERLPSRYDRVASAFDNVPAPVIWRA